jgi:hypothetical protein
LIQDSGVLPVIRDNRMLLAALGGAAAGAALALIFGSEKTQPPSAPWPGRPRTWWTKAASRK